MTTPGAIAAPAAGLFDRLGGFDAIERAVGRLLPRIAADPVLSGLLPAEQGGDIAWKVQMLLTDRLGGPMAYDGPDPRQLKQRLGIDQGQWRALVGHTLACLAVEAGDPASLTEAGRILEGFGASLGLTAEAAPVPTGDTRLVAWAERVVAAAGLSDWNLFVVNPELVLLYQNQRAQEATRALDGDLRRAFRRGAGDLMGQSILRFHPAPTRLQAILGDGSELPQETLWSFGRVVWKTRLHPVWSDSGELAGFAIAWRDETREHHARSIMERLRAQAEDLPVPVMFPGASLERWIGNAACEHALERLSPHLTRPVNPLDGVPIQLFLPDEAERAELFSSPARLPLKRQIKIGPETVSILVAAVLDEEQCYLGPQITWEIVYFSRPAAPVEPPAAAAPPPQAPPAEPAPVSALSVSAESLRKEARSLEASGQELLLLTRLLLAVADDVDGQVHASPAHSEDLTGAVAQSGEETAHLAEAALAVLTAAREAPAGHPRRQETERALATLNGIARRANRIALEGALLAVQDEAATQAAQLVEEARAFGRGLVERLRSLNTRAQASSDVLRQSGTAIDRLSGLRAQLAEPKGPSTE